MFRRSNFLSEVGTPTLRRDYSPRAL